MNIELERLANIFNLEVVPAEVNGDEAFALANIQDTDKIIYGPVYDSELVDEQMILGYLKECLDELDTGDVEQLNLWDEEILGAYSDGNWEILYRMAGILTVTHDLNGERIDVIEEAAADEITSTLEEIIEKIEGDME